MKYPKKKTGIITGMLLGDACIEKSGRLTMGHSINQKEYLLYKMDRLKYFFNFHYSEKSVGKDKKYIQVYAQTKIYPYLKLMRKIWYKPNKQLTKKMIYKLDEEGLCFWYLDDGSLVFQRTNGRIESRKGYLNTQGFTYEENLMLQEMLLTKFNINVKIHKDKEYYRLYFNSNELKKLFKIIAPYCPECMYYKLCFRYYGYKSKENLCFKSCDISKCPFNIN